MIYIKNDFNNEINLFPYKYKEIENFLIKHEYIHITSGKNDKTEENYYFVNEDDQVVFEKDPHIRKIKFPSFIHIFYCYLERHKEIPTSEGFIYSYISKYENEHSLIFKNKTYNDGMVYRLSKMYPSFIRDYHFIKHLYEALPNAEVNYNKILDLEYSIDVMITYKNKNHGIKLFLDTKNSNYYLDTIKNNLNNKFENVEYHEVKIQRGDNTKERGNIYLFNENHLNAIKEAIGYDN